MTYAFFHIDQLPKVDFAQVNETSVETLRYSLDGTTTFINWGGETPAFVVEMECDMMDVDAAISLLSGELWMPQISELTETNE